MIYGLYLLLSSKKFTVLKSYAEVIILPSDDLLGHVEHVIPPGHPKVARRRHDHARGTVNVRDYGFVHTREINSNLTFF